MLLTKVFKRNCRFDGVEPPYFGKTPPLRICSRFACKLPVGVKIIAHAGRWRWIYFGAKQTEIW